ncbi:heavy metal translocating P-type ATPase [Caulobacter sp. RHG1]|uniref:heavy metal translocating P-type ATPase n=1 Tax=Caulobacter sp. (strain RHG1) TaxID=2545762 RepID=UPI001553AEC8|nr:heavy metal translocating P-type ATPase [Caulobacter sp. RHG1]NQE65329.1 Lead, cadmium, zinc and mercury transporting ATPase, Copper-translocating P-type ATPase [Caulobacter sp. RHG1]
MSDKLRLALPLVLPRDADACGACVSSLITVLAGRPGVLDAHVDHEAPGQGVLCIHYDDTQIALGQLRAFVLQAGGTISDRFGHFTFSLASTLTVANARRLAADLCALPGVVTAEVAATGRGFVEFDREQTNETALRAAIRSAGGKLQSDQTTTGAGVSSSKVHGRDHDGHAHGAGHKHASGGAKSEKPGAHDGHDHGQDRPGSGQDHNHAHGGLLGEKTELIFAILSGVMLLAGWLISLKSDSWISLVFYGAAYVFGGWFTLTEAVENLRKRRFEIDTLMLVAAAGAGALGQWAEGALLLFLFSIGHALEHYAMGRARRAIEALAELAPERALVRREGRVEDVPVEALAIDDIVLVRPNERIPADGVVVSGESSVNQAPVTGESIPVDKRASQETGLDFAKAGAEHRVFAGTINGAGALDVRVARKAGETTLARVVRMVAEAEAQRSPTQRFTDRFEKVFVPLVLVFVGLLMLAFLVIDEPFSVSFYRAMAVLVAASPCALAISVPSAVLSGVARAGRGGVLVKGGGPLENLGTLTALAFDKTGTLTEGRPKLTDVVPAEDVEDHELLAVAVAVEALSDHPLAAAIVRDGEARLEGRPRLEATDIKSLTGQGIQARVGGLATVIGKPKFFESGEGQRPPEAVWADAQRLEASGRTVVMVRQGERYLGVLGLMDTARPAARAVILRLRALGIKHMVMLSGDNQSVSDAIARDLGLDEARGGLMPEDKVETIKALRQKFGKAAMVGDGVNDAPAMANATVGVAMGAAGSDVALETADVALMADDLNHLPFAVGLSRRTSAIIRQNLWVSLGVVAFLIPATIFGMKIGEAVIFHEGSTLLVVVNALRLLAFRERGAQPAQLAVAKTMRAP